MHVCERGAGKGEGVSRRGAALQAETYSDSVKILEKGHCRKRWGGVLLILCVVS